MLVAQRTYPSSALRRVAGLGLAGVLAAGFAGCSANIARLDPPPSFALGEGASTAGARRGANTSALDTPSLPPASQPSTAYAPPPAPSGPPAPPRGRGSVEVAGLPAIDEPKARALAVTRPPVPGAQPPQASSPAASPVDQPARGQQIEVQPGDTLYGLSRRHRVMISDLMAVNGLQNPNLKPGQKLYLPAGAGARPTPQVRPSVARAPEPSQAEAGGESYTVRSGDSLYAIASRHKVKVADLQRANGITNVRSVRPGTVLRIPNGQAAVAEAADAGSAPDPAAKTDPATARTVASASAAAGSSPSGVRVLNGESNRQAALGGQPSMTDASPATQPAAEPAAPARQAAPASNASAKLRWPVKGRVVQGFGARADGTHNDGIDIAVPAGSDVLAAESGVVAYAGNEVKTYGNLVLVRHDNGLVTAYAYNDKLLVQRGERVKRGQPIAKAGRTGLADQPQLHFEVRVGSKPVDPIGYLEKM